MARDLLHYNIAPKKYRPSKTFRKMLESTNKRLAAFGKKQLSSNDQQLYLQMIRAFNIRNKLGTSDRLDPNKWYTRAQMKELREFVKSVYANPRTSVRYYSELRKKMQEKKIKPADLARVREESNLNLDMFQKIMNLFQFQNTQEVINFFDNMNRRKESGFLSYALTSEEYQDLVTQADAAAFDYRDISDDPKVQDMTREEAFEKFIHDTYKSIKGKRNSDLYSVIFKALDNYEKYGTIKPDEEDED